MAGTNARHAARTRKAVRRVTSVRHISTPNIAISKTKSAGLCGSIIKASGSGDPERTSCRRSRPAHGTLPVRAPVWTDPAYTEPARAGLIRPQTAVLVRHLRDTLGDRARRAQPRVRPADPPGQHGPAVAYALVIGVGRTALAPARMPVSGQYGAPGVDRGLDGRVDLGHRLGGRGRHLLPPLPQRGGGSLPRRGELPARVAWVISHIPIFSPCGPRGQP